MEENPFVETQLGGSLRITNYKLQTVFIGFARDGDIYKLDGLSEIVRTAPNSSRQLR
jgi:hypothetical protein